MKHTLSSIPQRVVRKLLGDAHWLNWDLQHGFRYHALRDYARVTGWLGVEEAKMMFDLARSLPGPAPVLVELGSWLGQSSCILGKAIRRYPRATLYCVDPFDEQVESTTEVMRQDIERNKDVTGASSLKDQFLANVTRAGVLSSIRMEETYSFELAARWTRPIDLLFIDANHAYPAVRQDYDDWARFLKPGGWIVFHDVELPSREARHYDGPGRVVEESILDNADYEQQRLTGFVFCARKREKHG